MAERYLLDSPTLAHISGDGGHGTITVPKDSIVEVYDGLEDRRGLIAVTFNDHVVMMFAEDIRARGKLLPPESRKNT